MTTSTKVYIGIGVVAVAGLVYYFATKKPTATLVSKSADAKPESMADAKPKELTQAEADALVSKIVEQRKKEMSMKFAQGYVSPIVAWAKELKDGGYVFSNNKAVKQTASNTPVGGNVGGKA